MEKTKILILEANPHKDLSLNDEIRDLRNVIRQSRDRKEFQIDIGLSVRSTDLQQLMLDYEPNIVHFCGHGTGQDGLVFLDKKISTDAISNLFKLCKDHLQCVVLNACYSRVQADKIVQYIPYVIGMMQEIKDDAAIAFSIGFYRALGFGRTFEDAFKFGKNAIQLTIDDNSKSKDAITEEMRKLIPIESVSEANITKENLIPTLRKKNITYKKRSSNGNNNSESLQEHYESIIKAILQGQIVFFLGSDINLCDRIQKNGEIEPSWESSSSFPPSGKELANYLAQTFPPQLEKIISYKQDKETGELQEQYPLINKLIHEHAVLISLNSKDKGSLHVGGEALQYLSQYAYLTNEKEFYDQLQQVQLGRQPNSLHKFFATLSAIMREKGYYPPYPLIVTTNYDCALEQAFKDAEEPFDLVFYSNALDAKEQDKFVHQTLDGDPQEIREPNEYAGLSFEKRPVILKLYGTVDKIEEGESLVITEEHYIEYLVTRDLSNSLPSKLLTKLKFPKRMPNILFLGYSLSDWNQRIILHRIWDDLTSSQSRKRFPWWAIQSNTDPLAHKLWDSYGIVSHDVLLSNYISELQNRVQDIRARGDKDHD